MGEFIYRKPQKPEPHQCGMTRPSLHEADINLGDIWLCECGKKWRVGREIGPGHPAMVMWRRHLRPMWFKKRDRA